MTILRHLNKKIPWQCLFSYNNQFQNLSFLLERHPSVFTNKLSKYKKNLFLKKVVF